MAWQDEEWRDREFQSAEAYIENNDSGMHVPVDTGEGVSYPKDSVGAGPIGDAYVDKRGRGQRVETAKTANAYLRDLTSNRKSDLWIRDFQADFGLTGTDAQSKYKADFNPRFLTQPRYKLTAQCFNQEHYNRIVKFIRQGMIRQLATGTTANDLFELRIEDRTYLNKYRKTTRGGYQGWTLKGYVEQVNAGAQRFVNSPTIEFVFVLANATEGIMASLDALESSSELSNYTGKNNGRRLLTGLQKTPNPDVDLPDAFGVKRPIKKPTNQSNGNDPGIDDTGQTPVAEQIGSLAGTVWNWLTE